MSPLNTVGLVVFAQCATRLCTLQTQAAHNQRFCCGDPPVSGDYGVQKLLGTPPDVVTMLNCELTSSTGVQYPQPGAMTKRFASLKRLGSFFRTCPRDVPSTNNPGYSGKCVVAMPHNSSRISACASATGSANVSETFVKACRKWRRFFPDCF